MPMVNVHGEATARHEHRMLLGDGRDPLPTSLLDARERRNWQRMIEKVRKFWIKPEQWLPLFL